MIVLDGGCYRWLLSSLLLFVVGYCLWCCRCYCCCCCRCWSLLTVVGRRWLLFLLCYCCCCRGWCCWCCFYLCCCGCHRCCCCLRATMISKSLYFSLCCALITIFCMPSSLINLLRIKEEAHMQFTFLPKPVQHPSKYTVAILVILPSTKPHSTGKASLRMFGVSV